MLIKEIHHQYDIKICNKFDGKYTNDTCAQQTLYLDFLISPSPLIPITHFICPPDCSVFA